MSLTYKQIVDAVLSNAFAESVRSDAQKWVQGRHSWLWDAEDWTFKYAGPTSVTFTSGSNTVGSLPTDFQAVDALYDANGDELVGYEDAREFWRRYNANLNLGSGTPEAYTVVDSTLYVGPAGDGTSGLLFYEKTKPSLSLDADTTGLPDGYDLALVHGAKAEGFKLNNIPLWDGFDQDFTAYLNAMRRNYLRKVNTAGRQLGAWRPGWL